MFAPNAGARVLVRIALISAIGSIATSTAFAQSAVGSIYGTAATPGDAITITSQDTGLTRTITSDSNGAFNFSALPTGSYLVTETSGATQIASQSARVIPGVGTGVTLAENALQEVTVTGTTVSPIDVSTAEVSTTYSTAQLANLPVAQDTLSIALLAPGVTRGTSGANEQASPADESYSSAASFGGASIAENQYYIDGFNITNLFRNLQYSDIPYYAIDSEQIITGGYGPEYGLSTGGVVNIVAKKGTNDWKVGGAASWQPDQLRSKPGPTSFNTDGTVYRDFSHDSDSVAKYDAWFGGPIIRDHLFIFANIEFTKEDQTTYPVSYPSADRNIWGQDTQQPFGLVKVDWQIDDKNIIELTGIRNQSKYTTSEVSPNYAADGAVIPGPYAGTDYVRRGGWIGIAKYTGNITDDLTLSAQYGYLTSKREEYQTAADGSIISYNGVVGDTNQPGCPYVTYSSSYDGTAEPTCYITENVGAENGKDIRRAGRVDLAWHVPWNILGKHTLGAGYDHDDWSSFDGESRSGGAQYTYYDTTLHLLDGDYTGPAVRQRVFQTGASAGVQSSAFYFKDDWQVTKDILLQGGFRDDSFKNLNGAGQEYLKQDNIIQPRVGVAWNIRGDSSSKVYASYGVYSLPVTAGVSIRGASASLYTQQYYTYTAIDPKTGKPTLGTGLGYTNTPAGVTSVINGEDGSVPQPGTFAATNLDPTEQREFIVGFQQQVGKWQAGVRGTYRNLLETIDDMCDNRPFDRWAARTGFTGGTANIDNNVPCFVVNPGFGANVNYDLDGDGKLDSVNLSSNDIGLPRAVRRYLGFEFTLEKPWDNLWFMQLSYTWSHNYGNAEGLADSDLSQLDIGTTEEFDFPEIMEGAYGNLPNDHRHTVKLLAAIKPLRDLAFSGNVFVQTGKPISCIGLDAAVDSNFNYGNAYHYCNGDGTGLNGEVVPRGSIGTTPTVTEIDLGAIYTPGFIPGLLLSFNVYNVLNSHSVTNVNEFQTDSTGAFQTSYQASYSYQQARYMQLTAKYEFDFGTR